MEKKFALVVNIQGAFGLAFGGFLSLLNRSDWDFTQIHVIVAAIMTFSLGIYSRKLVRQFNEKIKGMP